MSPFGFRLASHLGGAGLLVWTAGPGSRFAWEPDLAASPCATGALALTRTRAEPAVSAEGEADADADADANAEEAIAASTEPAVNAWAASGNANSSATALFAGAVVLASSGLLATPLGQSVQTATAAAATSPMSARPDGNATRPRVELEVPECSQERCVPPESSASAPPVAGTTGEAGTPT